MFSLSLSFLILFLRPIVYKHHFTTDLSPQNFVMINAIKYFPFSVWFLWQDPFWHWKGHNQFTWRFRSMFRCCGTGSLSRPVLQLGLDSSYAEKTALRLNGHRDTRIDECNKTGRSKFYNYIFYAPNIFSQTIAWTQISEHRILFLGDCLLNSAEPCYYC